MHFTNSAFRRCGFGIPGFGIPAPHSAFRCSAFRPVPDLDPPVSVGDPAPVWTCGFGPHIFLSTGNHVTTMQNAAARLISGARKWASISTRCSSACWCQVSVPCTRTLYGDLCFAVEETWVWNSLIAERHDPEIPLHMIGTRAPVLYLRPSFYVQVIWTPSFCWRPSSY